ncbi:hypothetical protein G7054_g1168 [Neopestalotiopsis clavispora]|nr:hypothetical protein G7054_g1168 [Neopestalotiopsis clavispora]
MPVYDYADYDLKNQSSVFFDQGNMPEDKLARLLASNEPEDRYLGHAHLQAWSFFAVIKLIFDFSFNPAQVPRSDGTSPLDPYIRSNRRRLLRFDTTELRPEVEAWIRKTRTQVKHYNDVERISKHDRVLQILTHAVDVWIYVLSSTRDRKSVDLNLRVSVGLLYEYIEWASRIAFAPRTTTSDVVSSMAGGGPVFPFHSEVINDHMALAGWCPAELRVMSDSFTGLELFRLSFLEVPHIGMNHSKCTDTEKCTAYNIVGDYVTKHDPGNSPTCRCEFVYASQKELADILLGAEKKDGRLYVELMPSRTQNQPTNVDWTAISHVWSDGLGNNKDNGIPLCQFKRLCRLTSALPISGLAGQSPFWLDTLCFPLKPETAYNKALIRMRECYEGAKAVLVLDHYLLGAYAGQGRMSLTEVMARIIISPWNRRLWTWQEAYLAHRKHLFFQFKDKAICDDEILNAADGDWANNVDCALDFAMSQGFYSRFRDIRDRDDRLSALDKIAKSKNSLTFRSTSVAPDEALALSNILGIDTAIILNCKDQKDWMLAFWKHLASEGHYHASMIFWDGPKLKEEGFRWAPATFMDASRTSAQQKWDLLDHCATEISVHGLHVDLTTIVCNGLYKTSNDLCFLDVLINQNARDRIYFVLDLPDWSKLEEHMKSSQEFVVLLPFRWEEDKSWQADVQIAAKSRKSDDQLHLISPGTLLSTTKPVRMDGRPGPLPRMIPSRAMFRAKWKVD